uniref:(northern house mosquito) hypothetical protein n=1 Tax=Culex pipiens TaxID=7175 RepID=A0A8D8IHE0_CULPI
MVQQSSLQIQRRQHHRHPSSGRLPDVRMGLTNPGSAVLYLYLCARGHPVAGTGQPDQLLPPKSDGKFELARVLEADSVPEGTPPGLYRSHRVRIFGLLRSASDLSDGEDGECLH